MTTPPLSPAAAPAAGRPGPADAERTLVADAERTLVADGERTLVADGERTRVADGERTLVADGERTRVADGERTRVADGERTRVADAERALVEAALAGNEAALHRLAVLLTPPVQARVARALLRRRALYRGDARTRVEDLVQDTFVELFRDGGRVLRAWDAARGLGLAGFAGLVAEQRVLAFLRTRKASAQLEDLDDDDEAFAHRPDAHATDPEARAASREHLQKLLDHLRAELSPVGRVLFDRLLVNEEEIASVAKDMSMSISAVQAWSSRLKRRTAVLAREIEAGDEPAARRTVSA